MKKLFTKSLIRRAATMLMLCLIAVNSLLMTVPAFAQPLSTEIENAFKKFCDFYYHDGKDPTADEDTKACQKLSSSFAELVPDSWPDRRLSELASDSNLNEDIKTQDDFKTKWLAKITEARQKEIISDDSDFIPTLWEYNSKDLSTFSSSNDGSPTTVEEAIKAFCEQEGLKEVISSGTSGEVETCKKLTSPFEQTLSLFTSDNNPTVEKITQAWLGGSSLEKLGGEAKNKVDKGKWVRKLKSKVRGTKDNALLNLVKKSNFQDDLWKLDPKTLKTTKPSGASPTVARAIEAFCNQEKDDQLESDTNVETCKKLACPFEQTLFMFESDDNPKVDDIIKAWLDGDSLEDLSQDAREGVTKEQWISNLKGQGNDNELSKLIEDHSGLLDDLWEAKFFEQG